MSSSETAGRTGSQRLHSLDALRGFDMFWIIGGKGVVLALVSLLVPAWYDSAAHQMEHVEWDGFTAWDLIFPLFLFIAGVSTPLALRRRRAAGDSELSLHVHVIRRGLTLVLLGVIYNGLLRFDWEELRWGSVLGRIGLGYLFAALIVLHTGPRGQLLAIVAILLGYWAALMFVPVPGYGTGSLAPGETLTDFIDRTVMPGRLYRGVRDPEGLFSTIPAVATALLGALAAHVLTRPGRGGGRRALELAGAGALCLAVGGLWHGVFPLNKNLWSSSFVLWTAGWSFLLLSVFYWAIDVRGWRRPAFFFVVIGLNPITIYILQAFVDFDGIAAVVFASGAARVHPALVVGFALLLKWLLLWALYRRRWFLRV